MKVNTLKLTQVDYPEALRQIASPPSQLYWAGTSLGQIMSQPRVAIVGSRKATVYGRVITEELTTKLVRAGVAIISGLAFGVDSFAHKAALSAGGCTVAVLPSPIQQVAPSSHHNLAQEILKNGGALVSEYVDGETVHVVNFIARNRIVSALSEVLLITEATKNSGSLHTARFALEQGKTVMAVPGNISSPTSEGCNNLIKSGAVPVTDVNDVLFALKIEPRAIKTTGIFRGTPEQQLIFDLINEGMQDQEALAAACAFSSQDVSSALTMLELEGYIKPLGAGNWVVA